MIKTRFFHRMHLLLWVSVFASICYAQKDTMYNKMNQEQVDQDFLVPYLIPTPSVDGYITQFVRRIHKDRKGNLWLGTNGDGVIRNNGTKLEYFSIEGGFGGVAVRGILEDEKGNLWFGTSGGITKYDGKSFTNYAETNGLVNNDVWTMLIDRNGLLWIGTLQGISCFDGESFTAFEVPETQPDYSRGITSSKIIHHLMEDSKGRIWIATNGGVFIYDGNSLFNISKEDGLSGNVVNCILEDKNGAIWFATHHNGICRMEIFDDFTTEMRFTHFGENDGVQGKEVWSLFEDRAGNIWFPVEGHGVYCYDGQSFINFSEDDGLLSKGIQCIYEDQNGIVWLGGWKGLFRYDSVAKRAGEKCISLVTINGPWE